jgi:hypothetical protein
MVLFLGNGIITYYPTLENSPKNEICYFWGKIHIIKNSPKTAICYFWGRKVRIL